MGDIKVALESEFCPPIDTALFHAILSDFNIESPEGLREARCTLGEIKKTAEVEEATGFDPSGSSSRGKDFAGSESVDQSSSQQEESLRTNETEVTSGLDSLRSSESGGSRSAYLDPRIESLAFEDKLALLIETFPEISDFTVSHTLLTCKDNFERAVDELLTAGYLAEEGSDNEHYLVPKGVEGFAQNTAFKKRKGRRKQEWSHATSSSADDAKPLNKWNRASQDILWITQRTSLPRGVVSSCYHGQGASLGKTILALAKDQDILKATPCAEDVSVQSETASLKVEFAGLDLDSLTGIVRLAHPSTPKAHELAKATIQNPLLGSEIQPISTIIPSYARLKIEGVEPDSASNSRLTRKHNTISRGTSPHAAILANAYDSARHEAFTKASAAYRKSRSDPLMGGAASYYASVGHDARAMADKYSAQAADAIATKQSTKSGVDLHGVDVANAVRIALEKVEQWWVGGASEWAREGKVMDGTGFSIVTGAGRHSQGGKGRIGPAVKKKLVNEGWSIEEYDGVVLVRGKARR